MKHPLRAISITALVASALAACSPAAETKAPAAAAAEPAAAAAPAIMPFAENADVKPFKIGAFEAAALSDGALETSNDNKTFAINKTKKDVDALLAANGLPTDKIALSVQNLIVRTLDKLLLFDTGASSLFGPTAGKLPVSLYSTAVEPGRVTDIFISHAHGDHVGGLVGGSGEPFFPNATIHMSANEWVTMKAEKDMAAIVKAITPKVVEFQPDADIIPGVVKAVDLKGHTPGHSGYLITSGSASLLYQGDIMHHSVISVQQPDWTIAYDGDAKTAQATRKAMLASWAASGQRIFAVHFPFPGIGKYEKKGDGYVWVAEQ